LTGTGGAMSIWASGSPYEAYVGRWSRPVAREFLAWLAVPSGGRWLDVGCGTGALSETILREVAPGEVVGCDPSDGFIGYAIEQMKDQWARFEAMRCPRTRGSAHGCASGSDPDSRPPVTGRSPSSPALGRRAVERGCDRTARHDSQLAPTTVSPSADDLKKSLTVAWHLEVGPRALPASVRPVDAVRGRTGELERIDQAVAVLRVPSLGPKVLDVLS
jgi:hypothetical protein